MGIDTEKYHMLLGSCIGDNNVEYNLHEKKLDQTASKFGKLNTDPDKPLILILTNPVNISTEYYNPLYAVAAKILEGRKRYYSDVILLRDIDVIEFDSLQWHEKLRLKYRKFLGKFMWVFNDS